MEISGSVIPGIQIARKMGFPTINISNDLNIMPSLYLVWHPIYGEGSAIVMAKYCEIHFLKDLDFNEDTLTVKITQDMIIPNYPPTKGKVLDLLYTGLMNERRNWANG